MIKSGSITRGFTLLELMVSMAVGSIILLVAALVLGGSGDAFRRVDDGVAAEREARAAIAQLGSELSAAVFHEGGVFERPGAAWPADRIGFLSMQPAEAQSASGRIGDLCAVTYYLGDLSIGGKTVRCLMRGFRESAGTFEALGNGDVTPLFAPRANLDEPIAFGVVSFEARPKSRNASGHYVDWSSGGHAGPAAVALRLVIARPTLAARLKTPEDWDGPGPLGKPDVADENDGLGIYAAILSYGNHENP